MTGRASSIWVSKPASRRARERRARAAIRSCVAQSIEAGEMFLVEIGAEVGDGIGLERLLGRGRQLARMVGEVEQRVLALWLVRPPAVELERAPAVVLDVEAREVVGDVEKIQDPPH